MNLSQRLRTCARHTGLDAVIELLQEAADEIDALQARAQVQGEPSWWMRETDEGAAEWTDTAPLVLSGWTPLYTTPQPAQATQAEVTEERQAFEKWATSVGYITARDVYQPDKYQSSLTWEMWRVWQARALRPERVPMSKDAVERTAMYWAPEYRAAIKAGIAAAEAHHGTTAQAKKEGV